jgi:hypothetical protein
MTKGVSARQQHEDRLRLRRRQRDQIASALVLGSEKPVPAIKVPSAAKRAPARLPDAHYPTKRASTGKRQGAKS